MEILFIGVPCSEETLRKINQKHYDGRATVRPQQSFDLNLLDGLSRNCNIFALSEPPIESFPKTNSILFRGFVEKINNHLSINYIGLLNVFVVKQLIIIITVFLKTFKFLYNKKSKRKLIVLGSISFYTSLPVLLISKIFKIKVVTIVPDLPNLALRYNLTKQSSIRQVMLKISDYLNSIIQSRSDGYVFITKHMNQLINVSNKPSIVIEGFINLNDFISVKNESKHKFKVIMYAGTLNKKFGIDKLIDAFLLLNQSEYELWLFGSGDYLEDIRVISNENKTIQYKGTLSKPDIIELESKVSLLVNCRPSNEEFTKYSFPSKTLEYMASGTPLLTTKLSGIPDEYYNHVFLIEDESVAGISKALRNALDSISKGSFVGVTAKRFVSIEKNHIQQTKRIYNFLDSIISEEE